MFEGVKQDAARRGCFICNAAVDQARFDADVGVKVTTMMQQLEESFAIALEQSRRGARWSAGRRANRAAFLLSNYMGLRVLARSGQSDSDLQAIIDTILKAV